MVKQYLVLVVVIPTLQIELTVSQGLSTTAITNDGGTLTVGDEATISGGAGTGGRIQVGDISGGGVDEVIVNVGTGYEIGDTITFSSGTAEAEVSVVGGGIAFRNRKCCSCRVRVRHNIR